MARSERERQDEDDQHGDVYRDQTGDVHENAAYYGQEDEYKDDNWLDEGAITLLIVAGAVLFVFPEPATSGFGVLLLATGVLAWIFEAIF